MSLMVGEVGSLWRALSSVPDNRRAEAKQAPILASSPDSGRDQGFSYAAMAPRMTDSRSCQRYVPGRKF